MPKHRPLVHRPVRRSLGEGGNTSPDPFSPATPISPPPVRPNDCSRSLPPKANSLQPRDFGRMVRIGGGNFIYQDGQTRTTTTFWIDEFEVTIAQYADFLEDLEKNPTSSYASPDQPADKSSHQPEQWDLLYARAKAGSSFRGNPIDLNCPVVLVDYWDAFAYAKWAGRRLPTEEEWERAGRGATGRIFPWGDYPNDAAANTGADHGPGGSNGSVDGANFWAPVDAHPGDVSRDGVYGLVGNVEEWTQTWVTHPDFPELKVPVVRGGSFATSLENPLTVRRPVNTPAERTLSRGFRTAADRSPSS